MHGPRLAPWLQRSRKSTPYAAQMLAEDVGQKKLKIHGVKTEVEVPRPRFGREAACALLALLPGSHHIHRDVTQWHTNGCALRTTPPRFKSLSYKKGARRSRLGLLLLC